MNISYDSLITANEILADVITETEDYDYREFSKGWYISQIQQCLDELSFDTFIKTVYTDAIFPATTLSYELPANTFNVKGIWVYNGTLGVPTQSQRVMWKRGAYTGGSNKSFIAENKAGQDEDLYIRTLSQTSEDDILWASIDNGVIYFSQAAASYGFIHIRCNGTLTAIGDAPIIPQFFRQAVKLWVTLEFYRRMRKRNPRAYSSLFASVYNELYAPFIGKWDEAISRSRSLDSKARNDLKEYLSKMNY